MNIKEIKNKMKIYWKFNKIINSKMNKIKLY
jgi:hypothetical protein